MNKLLALVKRFEGLHALRRDGLVYPYLCPASKPTQGWGLLVENMAVPPITVAEAEVRLNRALPYYVAQTLREVPELAQATPEALCAIADFTFNLGVARLRSSTLRRRLRAGDWEGARHELRRWVFGGGKRLPGLVLRREAEAALLPK